LIVLETLVVEVEAVLNDRPLTCTSSEYNDMDPLTLAHLLYGRRITSLSYEFVHEEKVDDPTFNQPIFCKIFGGNFCDCYGLIFSHVTDHTEVRSFYCV